MFHIRDAHGMTLEEVSALSKGVSVGVECPLCGLGVLDMEAHVGWHAERLWCERCGKTRFGSMGTLLRHKRRGCEPGVKRRRKRAAGVTQDDN